MPVVARPATSVTKRESWRAGESFSPPTERRVAATSGVSSVGTPSAKSRTLRGSRTPSSALGLPTMSLVNIACRSTPEVRNCSAMLSEP